VNALNAGVGTPGSLVIPELEAIAGDDGTLKKEPDMTFYLSYDFYEIDNPHYHRSPFYGFHQGTFIEQFPSLTSDMPYINH
jgi:hypothetical protein